MQTSPSQVAVVTGANQGLGLAIVAGLRARLPDSSHVYLTGRDPARVRAAVETLRARGLNVDSHLLDVRDDNSIERFASVIRHRHGGIDVLFSNAAARITPDRSPATQVRAFVETNNLGTTRILRAFGPLMRPGGRLFVVASSFGTLHGFPQHLHRRFDDPTVTLDELDDTMMKYVKAVEAGDDRAQGWPEWINIPSKVAQVAAVRAVARQTRSDDVLVGAVCPGLVDTAASRPWFSDMTEAQSPDAAAAHLVTLALDPVDRTAIHGELVQFGRVLPWR
jgi:carbonyl reductase 1